MLLQISSRSDICALYPKWLVNRLQAGNVLVRNPYNEHLVSQIEITPDVVDCICFCTKDPQPLMPYLKQIIKMGYHYYFMVTITPYDIDLEAGIRPKLEIIKTFIALSNMIGKKRVIWRYDPILLNQRYTKVFHYQMFEKMAQLLAPYTNTVIISFIDVYKNIAGKFNELSDEDVNEIALRFGKIAKKNQLHIKTCSEKYHLEQYGIASGSCLECQYIEDLLGYSLDIKTNPNRANCTCMTSIDIGAYSSCNHGCSYCYACNHSLVAKNMALHDDDSPMLIGNLTTVDKVVRRKVASNRVKQLKFDFE